MEMPKPNAFQGPQPPLRRCNGETGPPVRAGIGGNEGGWHPATYPPRDDPGRLCVGGTQAGSSAASADRTICRLSCSKAGESRTCSSLNPYRRRSLSYRSVWTVRLYNAVAIRMSDKITRDVG